MPTDLGTLVRKVDLIPAQAVKLFDTGGQLRRDVEIEPHEFLELAEEDLERGGAAALINAISNAKRAIHCQVDYVLDCLGYSSHELSRPRSLLSLLNSALLRLVF